jgi:hypothetical protein
MWIQLLELKQREQKVEESLREAKLLREEGLLTRTVREGGVDGYLNAFRKNLQIQSIGKVLGQMTPQATGLREQLKGLAERTDSLLAEARKSAGAAIDSMQNVVDAAEDKDQNGEIIN